ncbi:hypothetical protein L6164_007815 [Bauhinia variegata]|uniref:Uncharacterized protein n=1 Tax=Bauhinia variegata TaxID=167791 RepID=A0ACB9PEW9_BAUVA|nr:hypothetical protein L6164_007815 [Bauhinia variegata]
MALSLSQSVSIGPLLHRNSPFAPLPQRIPASKASAELQKLPSIRCSSSFDDKAKITLRTCKNCKTQFDPALNHPLACRYHTAHFGVDGLSVSSGSCMRNIYLMSRKSSLSSLSATASTWSGNETESSPVEACAIGRNIRMSADKARRVIDQIRGRSYEETVMILELMPYRACDPILKLVFSAAANASNNLGLSKGSLVISKTYVNEGKTMKRVRPQARGRAHAIRKRTCHITVVVKGETKRKFESVYEGGTMDTPDSGKVFQYWHCCGSEDPFDPGCTASPHSSYDD